MSLSSYYDFVMMNKTSRPPPHQTVLADNEYALGTVDLGQSHLLVEGAVAPHHHGYAVREAPIGDLRG